MTVFKSEFPDSTKIFPVRAVRVRTPNREPVRRPPVRFQDPPGIKVRTQNGYNLDLANSRIEFSKPPRHGHVERSWSSSGPGDGVTRRHSRGKISAPMLR
jgi:hypothetical protein